MIISILFLLLVIPGVEFLTARKLDFSLFEELRGNLNLLVMAIPAAWIMAALGEELIFRGYFINGAKSVFGLGHHNIWLRIIMSSILFGFAHYYQGISGMIVTGVVGLIIGIVLKQLNFNLWFVILIHGFIDTIYFLIFYLSLDRIASFG